MKIPYSDQFLHKVFNRMLIAGGIIFFHILFGRALVSNLGSPKQFFDYYYVTEYANHFWSEPTLLYSFPNSYLEVPFIYGYLTLPIFQITGLVLIPAIVFAIVCLGIITWAMLVEVADYKTDKSIVLILLSISPPIALLFERGNIDLLIAIILILVGIAFHRLKFTFGMVLLAVATLMKFYLLPVFVLLGLFKWGRNILGASFVILISGLTLWNYSRIDISYFPNNWESSFGPEALSSILRMAGVPFSSASAIGITLIVIACVAIVTNSKLVDLTTTFSGRGQWLFLMSSCTYLLSCLAITSYSYRLYLLILAFPFAAISIQSKAIYRSLVIALIAGFFLSNIQGVGVHNIKIILTAAAISNLSLLVVAGILLGLLYNLRENFIQSISTLR